MPQFAYEIRDAAGETKITSKLVDKAAREMTCWTDPDQDQHKDLDVDDDVDQADRADSTAHAQLRLHREAAGE